MGRFVARQDYNIDDVQYLVSCGISEPMARAMSCRGVNSINAEQYVGGQLSYHDAMSMCNMSDTVDTINEIIASGGCILIYGDYDADGLSASSLLSLYFSDHDVDCDVIIPTRDMGYGMNVDYILEQFEDKWYDMIITVDCGISNSAEIAKLNEHFEGSVEIIVTDHHELPQQLPECLCVNPKMGYPFANLSGSGVAFKLVEALSGRQCAKQYLDLALIGTIADIMPMEDENRAIVTEGLASFSHKSMCKLAQLSKCNKQLTLRDIAMGIAPKINAAGRMGDPSLALAMLLGRDSVDNNICNRLIAINDERRLLTEQISQQATDMCNAESILSDKIIYVYSDSWSHGILGIVASRLKEQFGMPAVVLTRDGDNYVGSARSVDGIDLHQLFSSCAMHLVKFGGHKGSVGLTVSADNVELLHNALIEQLSAYCQVNSGTKQYDILVDSTVPFGELYQQSCMLQPMHPNNNIVYCIVDRVIAVRQFGKENNHIVFTLSCGLEVKAFSNYCAYFNGMRCGLELEILCTLDYDSYNGGVVGTLVDIVANNGVHYDGLYRYNYLSNIDLYSEVGFVSVDCALGQIRNDTLVLVDSYAQLQKLSQLMDTSNTEVDYFYKNTLSGGIVVSLADTKLIDKYNSVVAFCSHEVARTYANSKVVYALLEDNLLDGVTIDRDMCVAVYKAMVAKNTFDSISDTFTKYLTGKMNIQQYTACTKVLQQLGVLVVSDNYSVEIDSSQKVQLDNSVLYQFLAK